MAIQFPDIPKNLVPDEANINLSFDHLIACTKKGLFPGRLWCPRGVVIDTTTCQIYVAEGDKVDSFARVSIFSESGEYLNFYSHRHMKSLCGIALHGNNLYVTDTIVHAVFHLKMGDDFSLVSMQGSEGSGIGQFRWPCQLSVSTNGDVFIADSNNHRIQILDSTLHPIRQVSHPSLHYPRDIKLTADEMYVLSLTDSPCVHVFSHLGHRVRSIVTRGYADGMQVTQPFFFCLAPNKDLLVSDFEGDQIKIFSNEGSHLHTLGGGSGHGLGMFDRPYGLALTANLKLVIVSLNNNYRLQIFPLCDLYSL